MCLCPRAQWYGHGAAVGALAVTHAGCVVSGDADGVLLGTPPPRGAEAAPPCLRAAVGASVTAVAVREAGPVRAQA